GSGLAWARYSNDSEQRGLLVARVNTIRLGACLSLLWCSGFFACGGEPFSSTPTPPNESGGAGGQGGTSSGGAGGGGAGAGAEGGSPGESCTSAADCNDADPCTIDLCLIDGTCEHAPKCAGAQHCCDGVCGACCDDVDCDDGVGCTED